MRGALVNKRRENMSLDMIDRHKRQSQRPCHALRETKTNHHSTDKARACSRRYDIQFIFSYIGFSYGSIHNRDNQPFMLS